MHTKDDTSDINGKADAFSKKQKYEVVARPWILITISTLLVFIGIAASILITHGFSNGWLLPSWNTLSDGQANIIGNFIWVYAAALAATITPLLFSERVQEVQKQLLDLQDEISGLSQSTRMHFSQVQRQLLRSAGYKIVYEEQDLEKAKEIISIAKQDMIDISRFLYTHGGLNGHQKKKFRNLQAGKKNYTQLLRELDIIDKEIERSMRFIQLCGHETSSLVELNEIAKHWNNVKDYASEWYDY